MLEAMIEDGLTFALSPIFQHLADAERTFFAARVGPARKSIWYLPPGRTLILA